MSYSDTPFVSAIIITHNRLSLLPRAIESVLSQNYPNKELIVVIDGSTDGTLEYCQSRNEFETIYISPQESQGGNHARNLGILAAKGEYVALLDDDDYWLPTKLEKQIAVAKEKNCDVVYCRSRIESVSAKGEVSYRDLPLLQENQGDLSRVVLHSFIFLSSQVCFRRSVLIDVGLFDEKLQFMQDYELSIRLSRISQFYYVNDFLCVYRINNYDRNRLSNKFIPWIRSVIYILWKHRKLYFSMPILEQTKCLYLFANDAYYRAKKTLKMVIIK